MSFNFGQFSSKAIKSLTTDSRINIWEGAVRSGKTIASLCAWINYAAHNAPEGPLLMCGKTERTLKRNILDPLSEMAGKHFSFSPSSKEGELMGKKIYICGANDARAQNHIRGLTLAGTYGDELTLWPYEFFQMLLSRLSIAGAKFFGTTNPDSSCHWLMTEYLDNKALDLKRWHFNLQDNPNLPGEYVEAIKNEYSGLWYRRFILGEWCAAQGVIYERFDKQLHIKALDNSFERYFVACDYGILNPCVFGLFGVSGSEEHMHYHLIKEYHHDGRQSGQKTDADYADDMCRFCEGYNISHIIVDPSASSFIAQLRRRGFKVIRAKNDVIAGISYVSGMLAEQRFTMGLGCIHTLKEFENYVWDETAAKLGEDKPLKVNDHCMDMLRYALFTDVSLDNGRNRGGGVRYR